MSIRSLSVVFAAGLALTGAGYAFAQDDYGPPPDESAPTVGEVVVQSRAASDAEIKSETVSFADLDLSTSAGGDTLLRRINAASRRVCQPEPAMPGGLRDSADYASCRDDAVGRAVYDIDAPSVTAAYHYSR